MLRRYLSFVLLSFALLLFTPAHSEMSLSASSSLDSFSYDLDNIQLRLEKLSARWQLSPFGDRSLQVAQLKAKRLIVTIQKDTDKAGESPLPRRINLPFPISIDRAEIAEVVIITADDRETLSNVQFNFKGDAKRLHLQLSHADTPWGTTAATLDAGTSRPFPLSGLVSLKQPEGDMPYDVKAQLSGDLNTLRFNSTAWLVQKNGKLAIEQNTNSFSQPVAHIAASGDLSPTQDYPVVIKARISELHPERLGNYPAALLNFDLDLQGKLLPAPAASLQLIARDNQWQNQPVSASANLVIAGTQIQHMELDAAIAANRIRASGSLGKPDSHLSWQADLPDLAAFGKEYAGEAKGSGTLEGAFNNLALHFNLLAQKLRLPGDLKIEKLEGQATLAAGENGAMNGELNASNLAYGEHPPFNGHATLQGSRANHQLQVTAQDKNRQFTGTLQGGLSAGELTKQIIWQGYLQQLTYTGETPVKLMAPAPLRLERNSITLEQAVLQLTKARVTIEQIQAGNGKLISKGHLDQFTLEDLPPGLLKLPDTLHGSPVFAGKWDIQATDTLNGSISLWREAGDFTLNTRNGDTSLSKPASPKPAAMGLTEARIEVSMTNNQTELSAKLAGQNLGNLNARLATAFTTTDNGFVLLASSPFSLTGSAQLNTLAWLPLPATLADADIDGQLTLSVEADGSLGKPNLNGNVAGKNLRLIVPSQGVSLSNGTLQAAFQDDRLIIQQTTWQGGTGSLSSSGYLRIDSGKPRIDLEWSADKFTALSRSDRLLTLSGTGKTTFTDSMLTISGKFAVNKGLVELPKDDAPALGDDVIVLGQSASIKEPAMQILLNSLHIDLGKDFTLRGRGLDAELTGALTLTGLTQHRPYTEGSIQVKKGTYLAYGQQLNIERGILNFNGPIDNPGLNIRAMRNSKPVNAGVEITGSAFNPITKLVSDPNVPETEKLSWLVLGHGMDQAGKNDYAMLSLAAGVLLSQNQSVPLQTQLARAAGLDEFSFSGGDTEGPSLTFGKRLSSQLYLSYEKSISGLLDVARLTFNITPRWSLRAEAGTESAVDVLYTFHFK